MSQATYAIVYSAGIARGTDYARQLDALLAADDPANDEAIADFVTRLNDLCFGLETAGQLPVGDDQNRVLAYLLNTYVLRAVATDPFLRPLLPAIPATGGVVRPLAFVINGGILSLNGKGAYAGAVLSTT